MRQQCCRYPSSTISISPLAHVHFHFLLCSVTSSFRSPRLARTRLQRSSPPFHLIHSFTHLLNYGKRHIHKICHLNHFRVYSSMALRTRTFTLCASNTTTDFQNSFHHPRLKFSTHQASPPPHSPQPLTATVLFSVSMNLNPLGTYIRGLIQYLSFLTGLVYLDRLILSLSCFQVAYR